MTLVLNVVVLDKTFLMQTYLYALMIGNSRYSAIGCNCGYLSNLMIETNKWNALGKTLLIVSLTSKT